MRKELQQRALVTLLFIFLLVETLLVAPKSVGTVEDLRFKKQHHQITNQAEQVLHGLKLVETKDGSKEWELQSEQAESMKDQALWKLQKVDAIFYGNKEVTYHVIGDSGEVRPNSKDMRIQGNVVLRSSNGYEFSTSEVSYNSEKQMLNSEVPVEMKSPMDTDGTRMEMSAIGMQADMKSNEMKLLQQVNGKKKMSDGKTISIQSGAASFSANSKKADFLNKVIVDYGTSRIVGPQAHFDYDDGQKKVQSMLVDGGVQITDKEKWASAAQVLMKFTQDTYVLSGSPRVIQDGDELAGEQIIFHHGGEQIEIQKGKAKLDNSPSDMLK